MPSSWDRRPSSTPKISNSASTQRRGLPSIKLNFASLLEFLAAQVDRLDAPHVGDVFEGIFSSAVV
jgi:hypothetical protein